MCCSQSLVPLLFLSCHSIFSSRSISTWIHSRFQYVSELPSTFSDPCFQQGVLLLLLHQGPKHMLQMHHTSPHNFRRSHFCCQVPPRPYDVTDPSSERWNCGRECWCLNVHFHVSFRDLLHAANLRRGTDGFTSPPKEGVLRIFLLWKILTASAGCEPVNLGT